MKKEGQPKSAEKDARFTCDNPSDENLQLFYSFALAALSTGESVILFYIPSPYGQEQLLLEQYSEEEQVEERGVCVCVCVCVDGGVRAGGGEWWMYLRSTFWDKGSVPEESCGRWNLLNGLQAAVNQTLSDKTTMLSQQQQQQQQRPRRSPTKTRPDCQLDETATGGR